MPCLPVELGKGWFAAASTILSFLGVATVLASLNFSGVRL